MRNGCAAADGKRKPKFTMRDDGEQVEIFLPLPAGVGKKDLRVKATPLALSVHVAAATILGKMRPSSNVRTWRKDGNA